MDITSIALLKDLSKGYCFIQCDDPSELTSQRLFHEAFLRLVAKYGWDPALAWIRRAGHDAANDGDYYTISFNKPTKLNDVLASWSQIGLFEKLKIG